jgi:hypothetical protein
VKQIDDRLTRAIAGVIAMGLLIGNCGVGAAEPQRVPLPVMPIPIPPDPTTLPPGQLELCYGVVKAGKNDCTTYTTACGGTSTKDGQKDAWIFLPKGTCEKIVGSSLFPG